MAATRLTDSQKNELVARYSDGATSAELAATYGCSLNTISRVVKAALPAEDYARLKQVRGRGSRGAAAGPDAMPEPGVASGAEPQAERELVAEHTPAVVPGGMGASTPRDAADRGADVSGGDAGVSGMEAAVPGLPAVSSDGPSLVEDDDEASDGEATLAIDDADDFGDDSAEDRADGELDEEGDDPDADADDDLATAGAAAVAGEQLSCIPIAEAALPASVYMLVDKTVELDARPLAEFTELGQLPPGEEQLQALQVFVNPRHAKRLCGRSQRVIKIPDTRVFERTARYLVAQGISRLVIENGLYSLTEA